MKQDQIKVPGTYRLKTSVRESSVQKDGTPFDTPFIRLVRVKHTPGSKRAWFFDAKGNAYRASDFTTVPYQDVGGQ